MRTRELSRTGGAAPAGRAGRRGLHALYVAGGVSAFGTQMTMLALPWLVLESTGSATRTSLVFAAQVLPMATLGLLGGEVIQRFGAHRTMLVADLARAPLVALVPVLHATGSLSFGALLGIVVLLGVLSVPYMASQRLLAVELIGPDARGLTRANSAIEGLHNAAAFAGPATAGALITLLGAEQVLWIDAATYVLSAFLLLTLVPRLRGGAPAPTARSRGVLAGVRHLLADSFLRRSIVSTVLYGFLLRILAVALPLLAFERFDGDATLGGLLVASSGAGALVGSVLAYSVSARVSPVRLAGVSAVFLALPLWLLPLDLPPAVLVVAVAVSAAAVPLANAPYFAILTTRVSAEARPKVLQSVFTISNIAGPLGFLVAGLAMDSAGVAATLLLVAALSTLSTVNILAALRALAASAEATGPRAGAEVD